MFTNVDARGLSCPQPVIATKKALDSITDGVVVTIVDNEVSKENVIKFATANQCDVSCEQRNGAFYIRIAKSGSAEPSSTNNQPLVKSGNAPSGKVVYFINQDVLGQGSMDLGAVLMKSFFYTLTEMEDYPRSILFVNSGVYLTVEGSPVLELIKKLAARGVTILSCGTCLDYYKIKEKLAVGSVTNMYTIVGEMNSGPVVTL